MGTYSALYFFSVVLSELPKCLPKNVETSMCTDDICVWAWGKARPCIQKRLQQTVVNVARYLSERGADVSPEGTVVTPFTRENIDGFPHRLEVVPWA